MKKKLFSIFLFLWLCDIGFAQAPEKMSYQAVVRNNNNLLVSNHPVGMRISILQGSATGTAIYTETQIPTTNANGLIAIEIGTGTVVSGTFANIDWANGPYFVKTETDPNGGTAYTLTSSNQLLSVPYALYAKTAGNALPSGGQNGQSLTICDGTPTWTFNGQCPAKISTFNCADTLHNGFLYNTVLVTGANSSISYSNGNGGSYSALSIISSGVTGLTATLAAGTLNNGNGTLLFTISGTPTGIGTAYFTVFFCGKTCVLQRNVTSLWPIGSVNCNGTATAIVNVTNPVTGKTWMDRNLGATQTAIGTTDAAAYGDLYQWGRRADGHQCRNSVTSSNLSSTDQPNHSNFIIASTSPYDWRGPQNDNLWQALNGINNPCPNGYRLPTYNELEAERLTWTQNNNLGAFGSPLKITLAGFRNYNDATLRNVGTLGYYWTSTLNTTRAWYLFFSNTDAFMNYNYRVSGYSVRCIKD